MVGPSVIGLVGAAIVASAMSAGSSCASIGALGVPGWAFIVSSSVAVSLMRISAWTMVGYCCSGISVVPLLTS